MPHRKLQDKRIANALFRCYFHVLQFRLRHFQRLQCSHDENEQQLSTLDSDTVALSAAATIDRYLLLDGPTAANLQQRRAAAGWDL